MAEGGNCVVLAPIGSPQQLPPSHLLDRRNIAALASGAQGARGMSREIPVTYPDRQAAAAHDHTRIRAHSLAPNLLVCRIDSPRLLLWEWCRPWPSIAGQVRYGVAFGFHVGRQAATPPQDTAPRRSSPSVYRGT